MLGKFNADLAAWSAFSLPVIPNTNVAGDPAKDYIIVVTM